MELIEVKCNRCGTEFLTVAREGEVICPECGAVDELVLECNMDEHSDKFQIFYKLRRSTEG